jgi:type IV secretion system protein VirD4
MAPIIGLIVLVALAAWGLKVAFDRTGLSPLMGVGKGLVWRFFQPLSFLRPNEGAKFLGGVDAWRLVNARNRGLFVDGDRLRLSESDSFCHLALVAPPGAGKTTKYIIPNVLQLDGCSMLITDPSGEIWTRTSGSLRARGFDVKVLDLSDPSRSVGYNPMAKVADQMQSAELAKVLVASSPGSHGDDAGFWNQGAESILDSLVQTLCSPDYFAAHPEYRNLHNVLHLVQNFGSDGRNLDRFIIAHGPESAHRLWTGIMSGSEKVTRIYVSAATNALKMLGTPALASVMSRDEIDFRAFRARKTALFVIAPSSKIENYSFALNLLHTQAFSAWMDRIPGPKDLPVYVMADEFGHSAIPNFAATVTTIRKYKVSVSMVLQAISQLNLRYGDNAATTILEGGAGTRMVYGGADVVTTAWVEQMAGKMKYREYDEAGPRSHREENLINADRVRTLPAGQALLLSANKEPMMVKARSYFDIPRLDRESKLPPFNPAAGKAAPPLAFVDLAPYRRR